MTFSWPWALLGLLVIPLILGVWWWLRRRRRRAAVRVTSIALVRAAVPGHTRWRRRIPVALLILALAVLGIGAARPQATVAVPSSSATILLALDVSGSMCSTDVDPNRITAAEKAASDFITSQAGGPRIGLVAFAGTAAELVPPTNDTQKLLDGLKGLTTSRGTAIGQAILTSIDAIAKVDPAVAPTGADPSKSGIKSSGYAADAIVVLTDGANTQGVSPATAAQQAAERKVRVFTIGFGTTKPSALVCDPGQAGDFGGFQGGGGFGNFGGFGGGPLVADDATLKQIAKTTGGTFYKAENAGQLQAALATLPHAFTFVHKEIDLSAWFATVGGILAAAAIGLSLWWGRVRRPAASAPADADVRTRSP
jgi:Ca-activated chloride channel family protein